MQAKLLRVLQPDDLSSPTVRKITPVGAEADSEATVDVRVIAATNRDLKAMVDQGTFRSDLYYRLTTLVIRLPSLEERREDIRVLAKKVVDKANAAMSATGSNVLPTKSLTESACDFLTQIAWPGNVRQLNSVLARAVVSSAGDLIDESDIRDALAEDPFYSPTAKSLYGRNLGGEFDLSRLLEESANDLRRHYIPRAIKEAGGNRSAAARLLGFEQSSRMRYHEELAGLLGKPTEPNDGE
jgi:transcriptional regulator with PAS, ATPase and Fis domain